MIGGGDAIYLAGAGTIASLALDRRGRRRRHRLERHVDLYGATATLTGSTDTVNFNDSDAYARTAAPTRWRSNAASAART